MQSPNGPILLLAVCLLLAGCSPQNEQLQAEIAAQEQKVASAQTIHRQESVRLKQMQDSLQIKIRQNIALGMDEKRAEAVERTLLKHQQTLVALADHNLQSQRDYLSLLKARLQTPAGGP